MQSLLEVFSVRLKETGRVSLIGEEMVRASLRSSADIAIARFKRATVHAGGSSSVGKRQRVWNMY